MKDSFVLHLLKELPHECVRFHEPLSRKTTLGCSSRAEIYVMPQTVQQIIACCQLCERYGVRLFPLGAGANTLFACKQYNGVVLALKEQFNRLTVADCYVTAQAGVPFAMLLGRLAACGLSGLEWAAGIPATVGGAVCMNMGANGRCIADSIVNVLVWKENRLQSLNVSQCGFMHRGSIFREGGIVLSATFRLQKKPSDEIRRLMKQTLLHKKTTQPIGKRTAGSIFVNPEGKSAWRLIDGAGLRGFTVGRARISPMHANFIENEGENFCDILRILAQIKVTVWEKYGILLKEELILATAEE